MADICEKPLQSQHLNWTVILIDIKWYDAFNGFLLWSMEASCWGFWTRWWCIARSRCPFNYTLLRSHITSACYCYESLSHNIAWKSSPYQFLRRSKSYWFAHPLAVRTALPGIHSPTYFPKLLRPSNYRKSEFSMKDFQVKRESHLLFAS